MNSVDSDSLRIDIWDFNPEENVSDKFRKINEIKDGRGLRKFIKETLNASTGKTTHELIGSVEIPLKDVPSSGKCSGSQVGIGKIKISLHRNFLTKL